MNELRDIEAIRARMEERGHTIKWVAAQVGVTATTLSLVLGRKRGLGRSARMRLAEVLDMKIEVVGKKAS